MSRNFHKALIETQIVSNGILPSLLIVPVVRKVLHDVLIDPVEGEAFLGTLSNGHHDESVVGVRRLLVLSLLPAFPLSLLTSRRLSPLLAPFPTGGGSCFGGGVEGGGGGVTGGPTVGTRG